MVRGSRFEVQGSWFVVRGSRFEVQGSWFVIRGSRFVDRGLWICLGIGPSGVGIRPGLGFYNPNGLMFPTPQELRLA